MNLDKLAGVRFRVVLCGAGIGGRVRAGVALAAVIAVLAGCAGTRLHGAATGSSPTGKTEIEPDDIPGLAKLLAQGRLPGRLHAVVPERSIYVFTYYPDPTNVFDFGNFPLKPANDAVAQRLAQINRHDAVSIKGAFIDNRAPIHHIRLDDFVLTKSYAADEVAPKYQRKTRIPDDLPEAGQAQRHLIGKVHAVADDGRILVIEYGDAVVPVFVPSPRLTEGLFRNDKVRVGFILPQKPPRPQHLWLDTAQAKPLEVLERLSDRHGKPFEAEGALVRYPKSPQLTSEVYAVQVVDADNVSRDYTLLNLDPAIFKAIRAKLAAAWKARPGQGVDGRNKLVNQSIRVHAKGTFNLVARNQANAQILLASPDDLTITTRP